MYQIVENWYDPIDNIDNVEQYHPEMTRWESGFLCGLIKKYRPKKVVEIGTAEGGTSIIIQKCLMMLGLDDTKLFSVDLNERFYRDSNKITGYCFLDACKNEEINNRNHTFLLGKFFPEFVEEIGKDIDFILLDTVHSAPGELLDLLVCLKYVSPNAVVVFHDTALDHITMELEDIYYQKSHFITKMCFDVMSGKKYFTVGNVDPDRTFGYANIAAVEIDNTTMENIQNLFSALSYPWAYIPSEREIETYRNVYRTLYGKYFEKMFMDIYEIQKNSYIHQNAIYNRQQDVFADMIKVLVNCNAPIFLYGTGSRGKKLADFLRRNNISFAGFCVSDGYKKEDSLCGVSVYEVNEVEKMEQKFIVIASTFSDVKKIVEQKGLVCYEPDDYVFSKL